MSLILKKGAATRLLLFLFRKYYLTIGFCRIRAKKYKLFANPPVVLIDE